jgi:NADH-quinone oxidoreductase subunit F
MSENLSSLSARGGVQHNVFERMTGAAVPSGTAESPEIMRRLGEESLFGDAMTAGAVSFYDHLRKENAGKKVWVCNGTACLCAGTQKGLRGELRKYFKEEEIGSVCCLGRCHEARAFQYDGRNYSGISSASLAEVFRPGGVENGGGKHAVVSALESPMLTDPFPGMDDFYAPLREMLGWARGRLAEELRESGLRGRGGAGFPVHLKWQACRTAEGKEKFIVCNADEGDPGSFIDRYLMEERPHSVLAGMIAAAWFAGAENGILYVRAEYPECVRRMEQAIVELQHAGWLGNNIHGSGFNFSLKVIKGAGAYICGEETALLNSIEGQRPEVRVRPPYPTTHGLFGKPTIVNNVETFANIHPILELGAKAYASIGTPACTGPKLLSLDGHFVRPGIFEVAMGTPLDEVIALAGGFRMPVKALQIGGPLGCVVPLGKTAGLRVDFDSFHDAGFLFGHAGVIAIPETFPMIRLLEHLFQFTADESCGKCFPCRIGSVRGRELISRAIAGDGFRIDRELFEDLLETLTETSLCGLGGGLPLPVRNILEYFGEELRPYFTSESS